MVAAIMTGSLLWWVGLSNLISRHRHRIDAARLGTINRVAGVLAGDFRGLAVRRGDLEGRPVLSAGTLEISSPHNGGLLRRREAAGRFPAQSVEAAPERRAVVKALLVAALQRELTGMMRCSKPRVNFTTASSP